MSETPRTFVLPENINSSAGIIQIDNKEELHHLINVMRIKNNSEVIVLDNSGFEYKTSIIEIKNKIIIAQITEKKLVSKYPKYCSTLIQAGIKLPKLEMVVQKATEVGIDQIIIVQSDFSNSEINQSSSKLARLEKIILSAAKQSKRSTLAKLSFINTIDNIFLTGSCFNKESLNLVFVEGEKVKHLKNVIKQVDTYFNNLNILIGPEGGWSKREKELFSKYNLHEVSLGKNILRSETASILALGILFYEFNDD